MKRLDFIKGCVRGMKQNYTPTMLVNYCVFTKRIKPLFAEVSYQIFIIHQKVRKMASYYWLHWVQPWQHMHCTSSLFKWQIKN